MNVDKRFPVQKKAYGSEQRIKEKERTHEAIQAVDVAGGNTLEELVRLQKVVKARFKLRTSRVDWRTKTGVILWFCENWKIIQPHIEEFRGFHLTSSAPSSSEEEDESDQQPEKVAAKTEKKMKIRTISFPSMIMMMISLCVTIQRRILTEIFDENA